MLTRKEIPELKIKKIRKGARCIKERSFPVGNQAFFRVYKGDTLKLTVVAEEMINDLQVLLHTDISGQWEDISFSEGSEGKKSEFSIDIPLKNCGLYRFKVKYSFNFGSTWYWDNVPYTSFYVDPPSMKDIKMYTLIPSVSGTIKDWIQLLHHIKDMGFNAVHLLPVTELDASESPYSAQDLFNIDFSYKNANDSRDLHDQFEEFVEEAKKLEIKLCIDLVLNHIGITSRVARFCSDWIATDSNEKDTHKRAGCWDGLKWIKWEDLALIKYDHADKNIRHEVWYYMKKYAIFWGNYANYTGGMIRLDNLHSTNVPFFHYLMEAIRREYPDLIVFAELFTDPITTEKMVFENGLNLLLATPWFSGYAQQMRDFIKFIHNNYSKIRYMFPINSHDSGSPTQEYGHVQATIPRYVVCALMGTGYTGMSQGVEYGLPKKINFIGRQKKWEMSANSWGIDFTQSLKKIHQIFDQNELFKTGGNIKFIDENHPAVLALYRYRHDNPQKGFIILANVDTTSEHAITIDFKIHLPFIYDRELWEKLSGKRVFINESLLKVNLAPCGTLIFEV
ncbi:MAG: hypothetical protein HQK49_01270 [Oligoflexia bacterium]|nr:hypothetical protein [Oligoflexia bacterium]